MDQREPGRIAVGFRELFKSGRFSDLTLVCGDTEFRVHKIVLFTQSDVFHSMLGPKYKESATSIIRLDDDPTALGCLLHHLYSDFYMQGIPADANKLLTTIEIFAVADKYQVSRLREYAVAAVGGLLDPEGDLENWVAAVKLVDEKSASMNSELWRVVVKNIRANMRFLKDTDEFAALLLELPELMMKLVGLLDEKEVNGEESRVEDDGSGWRAGRRLG